MSGPPSGPMRGPKSGTGYRILVERAAEIEAWLRSLRPEVRAMIAILERDCDVLRPATITAAHVAVAARLVALERRR